MKTKKIFKLGILLFGILFLLTNCEKEAIVSQTEQQPFTEGYRVTTLQNLPELQPVINNVKKTQPKNNNALARDLSFLNDFENINTDEIIQYTNETGASTYTLKIEGKTETINFENLHLIEVDNGYIAYILNYQPDENWYYSNVTPEGSLSFDLATYQGHLIKYSLDREIIWSTNNDLNTESSRGTTTATASRGGSYLECWESIQPMCDYGGELHPEGANCTGNITYETTETCYTVWIPDTTNPDYDGGGGGGNAGTEDCDDVSGTSIAQDNATSGGTTTDCATNTTTGVSVGSAYQIFWTELSTAQQEFLTINFVIKSFILNYLIENQYSIHAQKFAKDATNLLMNNSELTTWINNVLPQQNYSQQALDDVLEAIETLMDGSEVDFNETPCPNEPNT